MAEAVRADLRAIDAQVGTGQTLSAADSGAAVEALQRHLKATGVYTGPVDGTFSPELETALIAFQTAKGLDPSGEVNGQTLGALRQINLFVKDGFEGTPGGPGQRGRDLAKVEARLEKLGYRPGPVDGIYDAELDKAVARFRMADAQVPDGGNAIGGTFAKELAKAESAFDHTPRQRREVLTTAAARERAKRRDDLTGQAAGNGVALGAKGRAVENLERHLNAAGYSVGKANETFGARTEAALKQFQLRSGLTATGELDTQTWAKLNRSLFTAKSATSPRQRAGEVGGPVKRTEKVLKELGFDKVKVDGLYDARTARAVRAFQRKHDLGVNGEVGGLTLKRMKKVLADRQKVEKPPVISRPSPNFNSRDGADIDTVVLHHTAGSTAAGAISTMRSAGISSHYVVDKDGKIYQLVNDKMEAFHAGVSALRGDTSPTVNQRSIGIEIVNLGNSRDPFTEKQMQALEKLVPWLMKTYKVPMKNLVGHRDVALPAGRKIDPADNFPWARVRRAARRAIS